MKKSKIVIIVLLAFVLLTCTDIGVNLANGRTHSNSPVCMLVFNNRYLHEPGPLEELRAQIDLYSGKYQSVVSELQTRPLSEQGLVYLLRAHFALQQEGEALALLQHYSRVTRLAPYWGFYLAGIGYPNGAAQVLNSAVQAASPTSAPATAQTAANNDKLYYQLALIKLWLQQGKLQEAEKILDGIAINESQLPALAVVAGDIAQTNGKYAEAMQAYGKALAQGYRKDDALFLTQYALCAIATKQDMSKTALTLSTIAPQSGLAEYVVALDYLHRGEWRQAENSLKSSLAKAQLPATIRSQEVVLAGVVAKRQQVGPDLQAIIAQSFVW